MVTNVFIVAIIIRVTIAVMFTLFVKAQMFLQLTLLLALPTPLMLIDCYAYVNGPEMFLSVAFSFFVAINFSRGYSRRGLSLITHPTPSVEVKGRLELYFCSLCAFMACSRVNFTFPFTVTIKIMIDIAICEVAITLITLYYM